MTVTSVTAVAVAFRATRFGTSAAADVPVTSGSADAPAPADQPVPAAAPAPPAASTSTVSRRAEALFKRLDSDQDGSISKDEFTQGAIELLKRASVRAHHRHVGQGEGIEKRDARWLSRLEQAFARVDANEDGALDQAELTGGLQQAAERKGHRRQGGDECPCPDQATTSTRSVTVVAIAIRRYTADANTADAAAQQPAAAVPTAKSPAGTGQTFAAYRK